MDDAVGMRRTTRRRSGEAGVALLISLFALLLICVVGVALIMASGTESALTGNYRSATSAYYAALAGLEEGRGRMSPKSPNFLPLLMTPLQGPVPTIGPGATAQVWYITNPAPGEPAGLGLLSLYPDNEYGVEFSGIAPVIAIAPSVPPPTGTAGTIYSPPYKWVRINAITAPSALTMGVTVSQSNPGSPYTALNYVNGALSVDQVGPEALEITALAVMPNGSQRMLQYVVAPAALNLNFPAALTLDGNNVNFAGGATVQSVVNGNDTVPIPPNCAATAPPVAGIGYTSTAPGDLSLTNILNGITSVNPPPGGYPNNYTGAPAYNAGAGATPPNVGLVSLPPNWQTVAGLTSLVQFIETNGADVYVPPASTPTDQTVFPSWMSATSPAVIVVDGDLIVSNWNSTGYGLLVVTGKLDFGPHDSWQGIVLVIGKGILLADHPAPSFPYGEFDGAVLVANTTLGDPLGAATATLTSGENSVKYSNCWINAVQLPLKYKTLSFREITPPTS
jgi:hypothetical protein